MQQKARRNRKFKVCVCVRGGVSLYVTILVLDPLVICTLYDVGINCCSGLGDMTLISAPVSTENRYP